MQTPMVMVMSLLENVYVCIKEYPVGHLLNHYNLFDLFFKGVYTFSSI